MPYIVIKRTIKFCVRFATDLFVSFHPFTTQHWLSRSKGDKVASVSRRHFQGGNNQALNDIISLY